MKKSTVVIIVIVIIGVIFYSTFKGNYNKMVTLEEGITGSWSQVENQYQRRD